MKICVIGDPHGALKKVKKIPMKNINLNILTGDIGKADLARNNSFERARREKDGLPELDLTKKQVRDIHLEIHKSTIEILKYLSKFAPVYSMLGNVGTRTDYEMKKEEEKTGIKLPYMRANMNKIKNFHLVRNRLRNINGVKIGFLEYFVDTCWVREFKPGNYKKRLSSAKKETDKAKRILKWFGELDILVCHQPPYGYLDKITWKKAPKHYLGKHAGSKIILDYIKKKQPKYVFLWTYS